jgi:hypothetical protein
MRPGINFLLILLSITPSCSAQSGSAVQRWEQFVERWRWMAYWEGSTELGPKYIVGEKLRALIFWKSDLSNEQLGFCSLSLGECRFYPDILQYTSYRMEIRSSEDLVAAFIRFREMSFGKYDSVVAQGLTRRPPPKAEEYSTDVIDFTLPPLNPPKAILDRRVPPRAELDELVKKFGCSLDDKKCSYRLMVPFYGENDLSVPVWSECIRDCSDQRLPSIQFFQRIEGTWWQSATDATKEPSQVARIRQQISRALLLDIRD